MFPLRWSLGEVKQKCVICAVPQRLGNRLLAQLHSSWQGELFQDRVSPLGTEQCRPWWWVKQAKWNFFLHSFCVVFAPLCCWSYFSVFLSSLGAIFLCGLLSNCCYFRGLDSGFFYSATLMTLLSRFFKFIFYIMAQGSSRSTKMEVLYKAIRKET